MSKKELKVKEETSIDLPVNEISIDTEDIIIPKILIAQSQSQVVSNGNVKPGEIYESTEGSILAGKDEELELVMLSLKKLIYVFSDNDFDRIEEFKPGFQFEEIVDGKTVTKQVCYSFVCLNYKDIKEGNTVFPYIINFMKTNKRTGQKIINSIIKLQGSKQHFMTKVFKLKPIVTTSGKHSWYVWDILPSNDFVKKEELPIISKWAKNVNSFDHTESHDNSNTKTDEDIPF